MTLHVSTQTPLTWTGDCLALGVLDTDLPLDGLLAEMDGQFSGLVQELIDETDFKGKSGTSAIIRLGSGGPVRKLALVGLGAAADLTVDGLRRATAIAARLSKKEKCKILGLSLPLGSLETAIAAQAIAEGITLTLHEDTRFKSEPDPKAFTLERVDLLGLAQQAASVQRGQQIASGVILARELVAAPPNVVTPQVLADTAQAIADDHGLTVEILEQAACAALGMGAFLGVAQASDLPPKFIHLTYRPSSPPRRKLAIVGKGLTFDSGGLNIKAGAGSMIELMKFDMGGAAATLGAAKAIAQLQPDVEVHFISAAAENMISGGAMRPGDILTASNGKTIEVNNTDAEGRLTLADALVFAEKLEVDAIVDLATLTGACIVALGENIAGLWSSSNELATAIQSASTVAGEKFWTMPLEDQYFDGLKSIVADMKNTGPRFGGAITAALFLKQFVKETPWAHLDIAGTVWSEKENGYNNPGATGFGVRTLVQWVLA
ncbi:leucyl aminopeptidase [Leptolyngbya sp. PCC 6406]|uniref:leucyl aminopeptidase n=1 Tax=Leptolyngbya sp. PCC 6406 TaxID=1173264 RepID=UPI0002AB9E2C|nr:leucyl aminopeptidase [Leptolyngbya sp. PCC 6406]